MFNDPVCHYGHAYIRKGSLLLKEGCEVDNSVICDLTGDIIVGHGTKICRNVKLFTHDHDLSKINRPVLDKYSIKYHSLEIGDDVWIGEGAKILYGCERIGNGAIIGAYSVVTHSISEYEIWAGNPARKIGERK